MTSEEQDLRIAAQALYRNAQRATLNRHEHLRSHHAQIDLVHLINEDYIAGYMQDGQMSTVRRFFCLFVMFDLFFITMLWFICIMLHGETFLNALKVQVLQYTIQTSLFDIILAAFIRFISLTIFYGFFAINHWSIIAFTTTSSCVFLIGKVFYYNWTSSAQPIIQVVMIIVSCLLAWGEAWFLDCRVIPQEKNAQRLFRLLISQSDDERSPLLDSYLSDVRNFRPTDFSVADFYSPIESAHNSDSDDDLDDLFRNQGLLGIQTACELLTSIGWKNEKIIASTGDHIQSIHRKNLGKIYRLTGKMNIPAKTLLKKLYYDIEEMPSWNPTVIESKVLKKLNEYTDITYQVSASAAGGIVESRDFVNLRCWKLIESTGIQDSLSTNIPTTSKSFNEPTLTKSTSELKLNESHDNEHITKSMTLSQSLGAKMFTSAEFGVHSDMLSSKSTTDGDEFVDANESQNIDLYEYKQTQNPKHSTNNYNQMYVVSGTSIKYEKMPNNIKYTRGENLLSCWAMKESTSDSNSCTFEWLMCLDLKGCFPRFVLDKAYLSAMEDFMIHLRKHCESIAAPV